MCKQGVTDEQIVYIQEAIHNRGLKSHTSLGSGLMGQWKVEEASRHSTEAAHINPHFARAHGNLSDALNSQRWTDEAVARCTQALRIRLDYAEAYKTPGNASSFLLRIH